MTFFGLFGPHIKLPRVAQLTDSHCGPAVMQMVFAHTQRYFSQDEIVVAAGIKRRIKAHGTQPQHMAKATAKLTPDLGFWFKQRTSVATLDILINHHHQPVIVNWQGLFYETEAEQRQHNLTSEETGHYSVVVDINPTNDTITLADPYPDFSNKPRKFSLKWFEKRWWDVANELDKKGATKKTIKTKRFIAVIAPKNAEFPKVLRMKPASQLSELEAVEN